MAEKQTFHICIDQNTKTALDYLVDASGLSKQRLKKHMQQGCVWLAKGKNKEVDNDALNKTSPQPNYIQRLRRAKKILSQGDQLYFYYDPSILASQSPSAELIADFGDYSVWNKPSGMLSQGSKWGDHCTIYRWAEKQLLPERSAFIVHRLDRAANGLIILAHKKHVASLFARMFEAGKIEKYYRVSVHGDFSAQIPEGQSQLMVSTPLADKDAISYVQYLSYQSQTDSSDLLVSIETGRKHQIRLHLSGLGFPVVGDRLYAKANVNYPKNENINLQLQAYSLRFTCPVEGVIRNLSL